MRRGLAVVLLLPLLAAGMAGGAAERKIYVDEAHGVRFAYPVGWLLNGDDDAATAKLRITDAGEPDAVVQWEGNFADEGPYKGTDFESGVFAYVVTAGGTEAECFAVVDRSTEGAQMPVTTTWNGLRARRLDATYTVAGTDDFHRMVATFQNERCYLFETAIVKTYADAVARPLPEVRWRAIRAAFDAVLASVRITVAKP